MITVQQRRSLDNLVSIGIADGADDFAIQERLRAVFSEVPFADIIAAIGRGRRRAEQCAALKQQSQTTRGRQ